ncbi:hypothetical protein HGA34_02615 [Candidatus Falkowbacteria bacterium]|nr:hypothetical protein [Candidatus Falkowbacteria bacterium]
MMLENKYARVAAYVVLVILNLMSFLALYQVSQDDRLPPAEQEVVTEEGSAGQGVISRISRQFFGFGQPSDEKTGAGAAQLSTVPNEPKFSRTSFFFQAPYIGSLAIPESWEGKYATKETGQSIDFLYVLPGEPGIPIFTVDLLTKKDWEKFKAANQGAQVIKDLPEHVFVARIRNATTTDQDRVKEYIRMTGEAKASWNSFRSHLQPKN